VKRLRFSPHWRLLVLALLPLALFGFANTQAYAELYSVAVVSVLLVIILALFDLLISNKPPQLSCIRIAPNHLSLRSAYTFKLQLQNHSPRRLHFALQEHHQEMLEFKGLGLPLMLDADDELIFSYHAYPVKRGSCIIQGTEIRVESRFRLWRFNWFDNNALECKVYPDFKAIRQSQNLDAVANTPINGLKIFSRRGDGVEFHQLREYRQGDSLRQIDWRATSKRNKLISREYQEEQNQQIIAMLDSGKRMNVESETGSHFDVALGALLMLGHTVLNGGDWFSMQSFGQDSRWLPNVKGAANISRVMNHFYDLYPQEGASDYLAAAESLIEKKPKRALVILVTTLSEEDFTDLIPAIKLLKRYHLVALVSITNQAVEEAKAREINTLQDADTYCAALELQRSRQLNIRKLQKQGVICVESQHGQLLPSMLNVYLGVKRAGVL